MSSIDVKCNLAQIQQHDQIELNCLFRQQFLVLHHMLYTQINIFQAPPLTSMSQKIHQMANFNQSLGPKTPISRFSKYKNMVQESKTYDDSIKIQQIFSHLTYTPIQVQSYLKETKSTALESLSTIQSELDSSLESSCSETVIQSSDHAQIFIEPNQQPKMEIDDRKPPYLQEFSKLNSKTPNFHHPLFEMKSQLLTLSALIQASIKAIYHVFGCALRVINKNDLIKVFSNEGDWLTLKFFMFSGWEKLKLDPCIEKIKPQQNFKVNLTLNQIVDELDLLLCKASRYEIVVNLAQQMSQEKYMSIRQNFFQIQERLIECSNALYSLWNNQQYPSFYYLYLRVLRGEESASSGEDKQYAIRQFRRLWELHEPVTCSQIGRSVWGKLHS